jgi:hypothetical protein
MDCRLAFFRAIPASQTAMVAAVACISQRRDDEATHYRHLEQRQIASRRSLDSAASLGMTIGRMWSFREMVASEAPRFFGGASLPQNDMGKDGCGSNRVAEGFQADARNTRLATRQASPAANRFAEVPRLGSLARDDNSEGGAAAKRQSERNS